MIKTEQEIERDFYAMISRSELGKALRGGLYREGMRPANSTEEDLVVKFLSGIDSQIQTGIVILNLYIPDIAYDNSGMKVMDKARFAELERLIVAFVESCASTEYQMRTDSSPSSMFNEEINQHLVYARLKFKRVSDY